MTLKEFSKKYGVPYHIVYESSYRVHAESTVVRDRDYPEDGIFNAVAEILAERIERHRRLAEEQRGYLKSLHRIAP